MNRLLLVWTALRSSLWFVPSIVVAVCVALAIALIEVDAALDPAFLDRFPRLFGAGAEGTRGMLSAIASATITVAGVVFSVTIVALSLTASQYTSRALRNFMRDGSNQIVLGAFVGIYAYCLVVLRTIRGGDTAFVPSLAALGAIVLAFVGIGLLIHFIHHISTSIQASQILAAIHRESCRAIDRLFPEPVGESAGTEDDADAAIPSIAGSNVTAAATGYIQNVDSQSLLDLACRHDVVLRLPHRIGDFIIAGNRLAYVHGAAVDSDAISDALRRAVTIGPQRTIAQDVAFGLRQIVDIGLKALSPAMNDPTTATMALDYLSSLLAMLAQRDFPSPYRTDAGTLRVIARRPSFARLVDEAFEEMRLAAAGQPAVLGTLLAALANVIAASDTPSRRAAVLAVVARVRGDAASVSDPTWRSRLIALASGVEATSSEKASASEGRRADGVSRSPNAAARRRNPAR